MSWGRCRRPHRRLAELDARAAQMSAARDRRERCASVSPRRGHHGREVTALRTTALLLALLLVAACADDDPGRADPTTATSAPASDPSGSRAGPFTVAAGATRTSGELTDGLPLAEGSV